MGRRLPQLALALCAVLALSGSGTAAVDPDGPVFYVEVADDDYPALVLDLEGLDRGGFAGHITIKAPAGFKLYPDRPTGSIIGAGLAYAVDDAFGSAGISLLRGQVVADELDADGKAAAKACASVDPLAIWSLRLSLLGQPLDMPIYVSQDGESTKLDLCVPRAAETGPVLPLAAVQLILPELAAPRAAGSYMWTAVVTPVAPDRRTLATERAYEIRALVPVPHTITLRGRYDAHSHQAVLRGRLTAAGKPRAGVTIGFTAFVRKVTAAGVVFHDSFAGSTRTNASGAFNFRKRISHTTGFYATVAAAAGACKEATVAPGGCLSMTTSGTAGEPITISVARH